MTANRKRRPARGGASEAEKPEANATPRVRRTIPRATEPIDPDQIGVWCENLWESRDHVDWWVRERGVTRKALRALQVGLDLSVRAADGGWRYTFPVYTRKGDECWDAKKYRPGLEKRKNIHTPGYGRPVRIFPLHKLTVARYGEKPPTVWLCAGEPDVLLARSLGLNAVCFTSGEGALPGYEELRWFERCRVRVVYDSDEPGRAGARKVARELISIADSVKVLELPFGSQVGKDLTDWHRLHDFDRRRTRVDLTKLTAATPDAGTLLDRRPSDELVKLAVKKAANEGRNNTGLWLACQLRDELYSRREVESIMAEEYVPAIEMDGDDPYTADEALSTVSSAWTAGPRDPAPRRRCNRTSLNVEAGQVAEFSDARLTDRIAEELFDDRFCWVEALGWREYDGAGRWRECGDDTPVVEAIRVYLLQWLAEEAQAAVSDNDRKRVQVITGLLGGGHIATLARLARGKMRRRLDEFDTHPDLLNTPSGVVDLRTGELLPHDPAYLMTKQTAVDYRPGAEDRDWSKVLEALPEASRAYLMARFGQALTGYPPPDDKLIVQVGSGENGKTSVNGTIFKALGNYAALVPRELLLAKAGAHPTELMTLAGVRFAYIEELPEARTLNIQRLKETIGTAHITARGMRENFRTFAATHTLFVNTNYRPVVAETDHGTWRRLEEVPYPYTFRKPGEPLRNERDRPGEEGLRERVAASRKAQEAALAELVGFAVAWYTGDRTMPAVPEEVEAATREWRAGEDIAYAYIDDGNIVADPGRHISCADFETHLNVWLAARNHHAWSDRLIASRFANHDALPIQFEKAKVKAGMTRYGEVSRPPEASGRFTFRRSPESLPNSYQAWVGVRFADEEE